MMQGRIQDFKLGGAHFKKIAPSGGRRENVWGISCKKITILRQKNHIFFKFKGGGGGGGGGKCAPPGSAPVMWP